MARRTALARRNTKGGAKKSERLPQQKYRLALDNASDHIVITDPNGKVVFANKAVERVTGYSVREVVGKKAGKLWGGQMGQDFYKKLWHTIKKRKKVFRGELVNRRKNGELYTAQATISPVLNGKSEVLFFIGVERDITESKKYLNKIRAHAEQLKKGKARTDALNQELEKFRVALEHTSDHVTIINPRGAIVYANQAVKRITGYSKEEVMGKKPGDLWGRELGQSFYSGIWETITKDKKPFQGEVVNRRKNGELYEARVTIVPVLDEEERILFFIRTESDVSDLKKYARRLEEGKALDDALLLSIVDGILVTDMTGKIIFVNEALNTLTGLAPRELIGYNLYETIPLYFANGTRVPKDTRPIYIALNAAIHKQKPVFDTDTCYVLNRETGRKIPLDIRAAPFLLHKKIHGAVAVWRDITRIVEMDRAKNEFISFASHQLRTPLTSVRLAIDMLMHSDPLAKDQEKYLRIARSGVREMIDIIESLLNISRIQMGTLVVNPEPVSLSKFIDKILQEMALPLRKKQVSVKRTYAKDIPLLNIDQRLMKIVLENLISNAVKFSPPKSIIAIDISKNGDEVLIGISDMGIGIPKDQQPKIFERLFRAHPEVKGTGIGLYMVKMAVEQYGGRVWFESPSSRAFPNHRPNKSQKNQGTTFYVTIPLRGMETRDKKRGTPFYASGEI
ncbi:PAS domain-containing sensor histidine kinase [Candidatus Kaiserbacteria bacterium]|nr:PAS domain-containing sensor histidine kinase [Candidatus Kaiserbacteria bacterium]